MFPCADLFRLLFISSKLFFLPKRNPEQLSMSISITMYNQDSKKKKKQLEELNSGGP